MDSSTETSRSHGCVSAMRARFSTRTYRRFVSRPRAQKLGFKHFDLVNAVDHKNYSASMMQILKNIDPNIDVQFSWRPFNRIQSWNFNLQMVAHLTKK